jgi:2'-5' RNA ligase
MIRVFFAIDFPPGFKTTLSENLSELKFFYKNAVRWIKPDNFHITLHFLKQFDPEDMVKLKQLVMDEMKKINPFTIEFNTIELFPNSHHPKYISLHVEPNEKLSQLVQLIGQSIKTLNYPIDGRQFRAHVSLGRILQRQIPAFPEMVFPKLDVKIKEVVLFQSEPTTEGSSYTPLTRISLS